jgi:eukaryotic-like serine/threonine-protein kinase
MQAKYFSELSGRYRSLYRIGQRIGNAYEVVNVLGGAGHSGVYSGMGLVYICFDHDTKRASALKTYQDHIANIERNKNIFRQEALNWIRLPPHPNIVNAERIEEIDKRLFIVLEYISPNLQGRNTLSHYLDDSIEFNQAITWALEFCYGMEHAQAHGNLVHRDIKPDNIMINNKGTLKITDFGLTKSLDGINPLLTDLADDSSRTHPRTLNKTMAAAGTPPWMAPEQFEGYYGIASDIYSFGIVLFQMCEEGRLPFEADNFSGFEKAHCHSKPAKPSGPLSAIILKCLEKKPENRFSSFRELRKELEITIGKKNVCDYRVAKEGKLESYELDSKGTSFIILGENQEAEEYFHQSIIADPRNSKAHCNLGISLQKIGRLTEAEDHLRTSISISPTDPISIFNLGNILADEGRLNEAIIEYEKAIKLNPRYVKAFHSLGTVLLELSRFDDALLNFQKANEFCNGESALVFYGLAQVYAKKGMKEQSKHFISRAISMEPNQPLFRYFYADILFNEGGYVEALDVLLGVIKEDPSLEAAHRLIGLIYLHLNDPMAALPFFRNVIRLNKNDWFSHSICAEVLYLFNRLHEAMYHATEATRINDNIPRLKEIKERIAKAIALNTSKPSNEGKDSIFAQCADLKLDGKIDDAIILLRDYIKDKPHDATSSNFFAALLFENGEIEESVRQYRKSLSIDPDNVNAHNNFGFILYKTGKIDEAISEFLSSLRCDNQNPEAYFNLGNAYMSLGKRKETITSFRRFIELGDKKYSQYISYAMNMINLLQ